MTNEAKPVRRVKPRGLRITLRILRVLAVPLLCLICFIVGLSIGFVTIGGGEAGDVFRWGTWKHLYDLVFAP
ncbi:DNA-directed RNA polymerase subunit beta [Paenibacillus turpanensis]|uniref:DNA-directed RNA polymerase subunit beta n=1 Tax=Paenibacillus turpanensis TaxID=2689078 RepID=UPI0014081909|nr:DNA-directed RNA polymerase subunit beta [Paenibacillus turpanensis]